MSITQCVAILFLTLAAGSCSDRRSVAPLAPSPVPQLAPQPAPTPNAGGVHGKVVDTADRPIVGAIVEVLDGAQAGMSATSGVTGEFMFPWPFDDTTLFRATKKGYIAATQSWKRGSPDHPWLLFYLGVLVPPVNLAGDYTVSFIADTACAVALPVELRTRTYAATMTAVPPSSIYQENTRYKIALSGAQFDSYYNWFSVAVAGDYVAFWLGDEHIVEQLAANTYLEIGGAASASVGTSPISTISTSFDGVFDYHAVAHARCESKKHQLNFTRR